MAKKASKKSTKKKSAKKVVRKKKAAVRASAKKKAPKRKVSAKKSAARGPKAPAVSPEKQVAGGIFLGEAEDYFSHVNVIALTLQKPLAVGDTIRIKGHTTDIIQKVESMEIDHKSVQTASPKDSIGIKIVDKARKGDAIYKI